MKCFKPFGIFITKTTGESQTSTGESQISTDESQMSTGKSQTSHRRLQTSHRWLKMNLRRIQLSQRLLQATRITEVYFQPLTWFNEFICRPSNICYYAIWFVYETSNWVKPKIRNFVFRRLFSFVKFRSSCLEVFWKKGVLKNSLNSQENTCVGVSFFNKVAGLRPENLLK